MTVILDTCVLPELWQSNGDPQVRAAVDALDAADLHLSVITIGEVAKGIALLPQSKRRVQIETWLAQTERDFGERVLGVDNAIGRLWGELSARAQKMGRPLGAMDGYIAATALYRGLSVMTRNVKDFAPTGVTVIDPWTD